MYLTIYPMYIANGCCEHPTYYTLANLLLFICLWNLSFTLEFKSDVIKDVSSANMSHLYATVEALMKQIKYIYIYIYIYKNIKFNKYLINIISLTTSQQLSDQ